MANRRTTLIALGALVVLVGGPAAMVAYRNIQIAREYEGELRLARSEGLATNSEDFASLIPTADPSDNAAPHYAKLRGLAGSLSDLRSLEQRLTYQPTASALEEAERVVSSSQTALDIAEEATKLPKCWFDRDWSLGAAVLMPELSEMRTLARLLALRGAIAAYRGDAAAALADIARIRTVAAHARSDRTAIALLSGDAMEQIAMNSLAGWAHMHRDQPAYRKALARLIEDLPRPDPKLETRGNLFEALSIIELCSTPEGQAALGLKKEDLPGIERYAALLVNRAEARVKIVRAFRTQRAALDLPPGKRYAKLEAAATELRTAMMAFPTAHKVFFLLMDDTQSKLLDHRETRWEANRQRWRGLVRALEGSQAQAKIKVDDLLSPFDGKPLEYLLKGRQMRLSVSGDERALVVPSDSALAKP